MSDARQAGHLHALEVRILQDLIGDAGFEFPFLSRAQNNETQTLTHLGDISDPDET